MKRCFFAAASLSVLASCGVFEGFFDALDRATQEPRFAFVEEGAVDGNKVLRVAALQPDDPNGVEPPAAILFRPELDTFGPGEGLSDLALSPDGAFLAATYLGIGLNLQDEIRVYGIDDNRVLDSFNLAGDAQAIANRCTQNQAFKARPPQGVSRGAIRGPVTINAGGSLRLVGWDPSIDAIEVSVRTTVTVEYDVPGQGTVSKRLPGQTEFFVEYSIGASGASLVECREQSATQPLPGTPIVTLSGLTDDANRIQRNGTNVVNMLRRSERIAPRFVLRLDAQRE
ncbi:hypothetical protein [uncultured Roseobacter sp.]|uniref:hypothetical protein n=1 Tax=uncultured Roseobacter sp. TaxID=114847 RepID=UPI00260564BA|nr:hypothetical protein [uncultured Roseobacter sp.]